VELPTSTALAVTVDVAAVADKKPCPYLKDGARWASLSDDITFLARRLRL